MYNFAPELAGKCRCPSPGERAGMYGSPHYRLPVCMLTSDTA